MTVRTAVVAAALVVLATACSTGEGSNATDATVPPDDDLGRVVALGEEYLLADLLALGVRPVASTATVPTAGFQGLAPGATEGIRALSSTEPDLEALAGLAPDTIVAPQYVVDEVGATALEALGEVVVLPDDEGTADRLLTLGRALDRTDEAAALLDDLATAEAEAAAAVPDDCEVAIVSVYPGPAPAAWVTPDSDLAGAATRLGCTLVPAAAGAVDDNGRLFLSLEQLGLLDAPVIVTWQSTAVDGEAEALAAVEGTSVWQGLPAVTDGRVVRIDRLGHPGVSGLIDLYRELGAGL